MKYKAEDERRVRATYSLDPETVRDVERWADEYEMTRSRAVEQMTAFCKNAADAFESYLADSKAVRFIEEPDGQMRMAFDV